MKPGRPPDVIAAARARGDRKGLQDSITGTATSQSYRNGRPYVVVAVAFDRRTEWGRYSTRDEAERIASRLRAHAMNAIVEAAS